MPRVCVCACADVPYARRESSRTDPRHRITGRDKGHLSRALGAALWCETTTISAVVMPTLLAMVSKEGNARWRYHTHAVEHAA
jgi:hypothetical protein